MKPASSAGRLVGTLDASLVGAGVLTTGVAEVLRAGWIGVLAVIGELTGVGEGEQVVAEVMVMSRGRGEVSLKESVPSRGGRRTEGGK